MNTDEAGVSGSGDSPPCDGRSNDTQGDNRWTAFRYVLGEMSASEEESFEERLESDQPTRELVAQCTELLSGLHRAGLSESRVGHAGNGEYADDPVRARSNAIRAANRLETASNRTHAPARWLIAGLAAAVCMTIAVGLTLLPFRGRAGLEDLSWSDLADNGALIVGLWSDQLADSPSEPRSEVPSELGIEQPEPGLLSDASTASPSDEVRLARSAATRANDSRIDASASSDSDEDSDVPGWMVAAVESGSSKEIREN